MSDVFYKMFYFFLFSYAIYTCIRACIRDSNSESPVSGNNEEQGEPMGNNGERNISGNNNSSEGENDRRELVRKSLEFRQILNESSLKLTGPSNNSKSEEIDEQDSEAERIQPEIDEDALGQLIEMGFSKNGCRRSLQAVGGSDTVAATEWILEHNQDADFNDPLPQYSTKSPSDESPDDPQISAADKLDNTNSSVLSFLSSSISFLRAGASGIDSRNEECCSICLEPYNIGDTVARLKNVKGSGCNHWFHEDCITEWLQNHDECPLCRVKMVQG